MEPANKRLGPLRCLFPWITVIEGNLASQLAEKVRFLLRRDAIKKKKKKRKTNQGAKNDTNAPQV